MKNIYTTPKSHETTNHEIIKSHTTIKSNTSITVHHAYCAQSPFLKHRPLHLCLSNLRDYKKEVALFATYVAHSYTK